MHGHPNGCSLNTLMLCIDFRPENNSTSVENQRWCDAIDVDVKNPRVNIDQNVHVVTRYLVGWAEQQREHKTERSLFLLQRLVIMPRSADINYRVPNDIPWLSVCTAQNKCRTTTCCRNYLHDGIRKIIIYNNMVCTKLRMMSLLFVGLG